MLIRLWSNITVNYRNSGRKGGKIESIPDKASSYTAQLFNPGLNLWKLWTDLLAPLNLLKGSYTFNIFYFVVDFDYELFGKFLLTGVPIHLFLDQVNFVLD